MRFAGIDIGSERHVVAIVDQTGAVVLKATAIMEDATGYKRLLELLGSASDCVVAMEVTGHYWRNLFAALVTAGFKITLINPLRSSRFAEEELQRTKTDAIDALGIARFAAQKRPEITQLPEPALQELRELVRFKEQLVQQFGDRVRQLHRAVDLGFPEFTRHIRTLDGELANAVLRRYQLLLRCEPYRSEGSPASVMTAVTTSARNWRVPCSKRPGNQLVPITANPTNCRCAMRARISTFCAAACARSTAISNDAWSNMRSESYSTTIEGIGPQTAARIIAEVGDPARFHSARGLASYVGVIPRLHQSGKRKFSSSAKVPLGNARLRRALWMPAITAIHHNPWLHAYYQHLRAAGKRPKVALVAIIRKLMTAVYSVAKHRRPFVLPPIFTPAAGGAVVPST